LLQNGQLLIFLLWHSDRVTWTVLFHLLYNVSTNKTNGIGENAGIQSLCMQNYQFR